MAPPMEPLQNGRRDLLLAPLLAALPLALAGSAEASPLDPSQTIIRPPAEHAWKPIPATPNAAWTCAR